MRLCGKSAITGKYERRIKDEIDKVLDDSFDDNNGGNSTDSEGFAKPYLPPLRNKIVKGQPAEGDLV